MPATSKSTRQGTDAIEMLKADHKAAKALFKKFAALKDDTDPGNDEEKAAIVQQICDALTIHTELEEEIFYPAVREAIADEDLMDEALVEHAGAKELIAQLQEMAAEDDLYDAKVTVLGEQIDHHVEEEETDMFPKARKAKVDTIELGALMSARREELMAEADDGSATPKRKGSAGNKDPELRR